MSYDVILIDLLIVLRDYIGLCKGVVNKKLDISCLDWKNNIFEEKWILSRMSYDVILIDVWVIIWIEFYKDTINKKFGKNNRKLTEKIFPRISYLMIYNLWKEQNVQRILNIWYTNNFYGVIITLLEWNTFLIWFLLFVI